MKLIILGSGRMGIRHAQGALGLDHINSITLVDMNQASLDNAASILKSDKCRYILLEDFKKLQDTFDVAIIAATAANRIEQCKLIISKGVKSILIEKPLGQSMQEVEGLVEFFRNNTSVKAFVNLNMRLYKSFRKLRDDLATLPQFKGDKIITINTGTLGIGANGIHYLDLLMFLLDADRYDLVAAEIDDEHIPSGRGPEFRDFGGWCVAKFYKGDQYAGRAMLSMSATSTVVGNWEIVGPHGYITVSEIEQKRFTKLRKPDSEMPVQRYAADYLPQTEEEFVSPFLGDLTRDWLKDLSDGHYSLPTLEASLKAHELMFNWLSKNALNLTTFPVT